MPKSTRNGQESYEQMFNIIGNQGGQIKNNEVCAVTENYGVCLNKKNLS